MPSTLNDNAAAPAALSAFLRGVERRAAVFGQLQCGDREAGDTALAAAMRAFRNHAATLPMVDWPQRFWALLVTTPQFRRQLPLAQWGPQQQWLAALAPGPRQALLLRLAAGLTEDEAAAVLVIPLLDYQQALAAACPRDATGQVDGLAWQALAESIQQQLRDLPPDRLARLASLRDAAIRGARIERTAPPAVLRAATPLQDRLRRRWPWIGLVVVLCALALGATWWWPQWQASHGLASGPGQLGRELQISVEELPAEAPRSTFSAETALLTHADFEWLLDPQEDALARDADFYAWYAASKLALPEASETEVAPLDPASGAETADAQL